MDFIKKVFGAKTGNEPAAHDEHDIQVATCALFLEIANSDNEFSDSERDKIIEILRSEFSLTKEEAVAVTVKAAGEIEGAIDTWHFTNLINENYNNDEKMRVVELIWRVVYADGRLDGHEDYLVHKLAKLLRLQHKHLIATKLRVLDEGKK